jgi:O-antigen biosynthesis protein
MALYRGARGVVLGSRDSRTSPARRSPAVEHGVRMIPRVALIASPRPEYRLNLVLPTVDAARAFGGIQTAVDVFEALGSGLGQRRIISVGPAAPEGRRIASAYSPVEAGSDPDVPLQVVALGQAEAPLAVRPNDVFVATFWTTADLVARIRRWQASTYGFAPARFAYVIQDYEPAFYPWSAPWALARATYASSRDTIGVFNTSLLRDYFHSTGIEFQREFSFEPRLLPVLRAAMASPPAPRSRTIVVYGRPGTPRNAFPAIVDGLLAWRAGDPRAAEWTIVSVGQVHPEIDLGGGVVVRSIGKLDLDAYASLLREAAIGISLMVSPHPSYPPLEMAYLGMLVLTNRFGDKDLTTWHSNITSTDDVSADAIAARLTELCRRFEADPGLGAAGLPGRPDLTANEPQFPFAAQLAAELREGADRGAIGVREPG